jgi:hypothetical protein
MKPLYDDSDDFDFDFESVMSVRRALYEARKEEERLFGRKFSGPGDEDDEYEDWNDEDYEDYEEYDENEFDTYAEKR